MLNKKTAVLGSTGSVGTQTLSVCDNLGAEVVYIAAEKNITLLEEQIRRFRPRYCVAADTDAAKKLKIAVADTDTAVYGGYDTMCDLAGEAECDIVFNSVSGKNGLLPSLSALSSGRTLALANKETMVCAGEIVNRTASENKGKILPVDSEHCAVFQCLQNGAHDEVKRILLTASGGPFFGYDKEMLARVTLADALKHPTWNMGRKITVDSATLANKGLEIIEAMHLFGVGCDCIKVLIHRESIIHSMVEYKDNAIIAQLGVPDMMYPAQYALTYPQRVDASVGELDLTALSGLTFYEPDLDAFPMLALAKQCAHSGGIMPCVYNAANEIAAGLFLREQIRFCDIFPLVFSVVSQTSNILNPTLDDILSSDRTAREIARINKEKL